MSTNRLNRKCSRCKIARYCNRDCQIRHWTSGGHKSECFPPETQNMQIFRLMRMNDPSFFDQEASGKEAYDALNGPGCAVHLGTDDETGNTKILTDKWQLEDGESCPASLPPELYLPHVQPALLYNAEDKYNEHSIFPHEPSKIFHCIKLLEHISVDDYPAFSSGFFKHAIKSLFTITDQKEKETTLNFLQEVVHASSWTHQCFSRTTSTTQEKAELLVGKVLRLDAGIEMVYVTPPILCFADLKKAELAFLNEDNRHPVPFRHTLPPLMSPVAAYRCVEEGWILVRVNPWHHQQYSLDEEKKLSFDTKDSLFLKVFMAAAEFGDVAAFYGAWQPARKFSVFFRKNIPCFLSAAKKLLQQVLAIHPQPQREESFFQYQIGVVHEAQASLLLKDKTQKLESKIELLAAARCYHKSAAATHRFHHSRGMRRNVYIPLAVALERLGEFEMAKRAYLWAMTDSSSWSAEAKSQLGDSLENIWYALRKPSHSIRDDKKGLKIQRSTLRKLNTKDCYLVSCGYCKSDIRVAGSGDSSGSSEESHPHCELCETTYCTRKCKAKDMLEHENMCKDIILSVHVKEDGYGTLCHETRALLDRSLSAERVLTIPLAEASKFIDIWKQREQSRIDIPLSLLPGAR